MLPTVDDEWVLVLPNQLMLVARISLSRYQLRRDRFRWCILVDSLALSIDAEVPPRMDWFGMPPMYTAAEQAFEDARTVLGQMGFIKKETPDA